MKNPRIRPLTAGDLPGLADLCNRSLPLDPFTADLLNRKLFAGPNVDPTLNLVAEIDHRIVGVIAGAIHTPAQPADEPSAGFLKLWAVDPHHQGQTIGTTLLTEWEAAVRKKNAERIITLAAPGYFWPGVDLRYTRAAAILEACNYTADRSIANMTVNLNPQATLANAEAETNSPSYADSNADLTKREADLRAAGFTIARLSAKTLAATIAFIRDHFNEIWVHEVGETLDNEPVSAFIALHAEGVVGFAAFDVVMFPGCFGPMGTDPAKRGQGIGQLLLEKCLEDMRKKGYAQGEIVWVGPMGFYSKTVGATVCRQFRNYTKNLS